LWAITPKENGAVHAARCGKKIDGCDPALSGSLEISGSKENAALADRDGIWLYRTLVAPAQSLIAKGGRVFIFADAVQQSQLRNVIVRSQSQGRFRIRGRTSGSRTSQLYAECPSRGGAERA